MLRRLLFALPLPIAIAVSLAAEPPAPIPPDSLPQKLDLDKIPLGLDVRPAPKDNPLTEARVVLGRKLFFDPILSGDNSVACASCHKPSHGFSSEEAKPRGIGGQQIDRRAPSLFNRAFGTAFFWDGRVATLEEQALQPIENPKEMGSSVAAAIKRLQDNPDYQARFKAAFPDGITSANLARAIASFERVLLRGNSPVDRFRKNGKHDALTPQQRHGLWIYESRGLCWRCHSGANFSDESFHNTGVSWAKEPLDLGRFALTKKEADRGKFKTPTLRGVALSGPYMHDGSIKSLQEAVEFYSRGGGANPHLDAAIQPLNLSKDEIEDLVAFLKSL